MAYVLHQLLSESAANYPDKAALVYRDDVMTYAELERESNRLAHGLAEMGVVSGDRVGLYLERGCESIIGALGILKAGAAYVPIDPFCPPVRLSYILNKCGIKSLLMSKDKLSSLERVLPTATPVERILVMNRM